MVWADNGRNVERVCKDLRPQCHATLQDCAKVPLPLALERIASIHFSHVQKPWSNDSWTSVIDLQVPDLSHQPKAVMETFFI